MRKSFRELSKRQKNRRTLLLYCRNNFEPHPSNNDDAGAGDMLSGPPAVHGINEDVINDFAEVSVSDASIMHLETNDK